MADLRPMAVALEGALIDRHQVHLWGNSTGPLQECRTVGHSRWACVGHLLTTADHHPDTAVDSESTQTSCTLDNARHGVLQYICTVMIIIHVSLVFVV